MKKIFILLLLICSTIFGNNEDSYNTFEKFSFRMSLTPFDYYNTVLSKTNSVYSSQLNVGNYLSFMPARIGAVNYMEFASDVLQKDFQLISVNKKGKIKTISPVVKYDSSNFFNNYQEGVLKDKAEVSSLGMVYAGVKITDTNEYKITSYLNGGMQGGIETTSNAVNMLNVLFIPRNIAFYIKKINDTEIVWSPNKDYNNLHYTFTIENNKVIGKDRKGNLAFSLHREGNSLIIFGEDGDEKITVNTENNSIDFYRKGKLKTSYKYQIVE